MVMMAACVEENEDFQVATVNGTPLYASDIGFMAAQAHEMLFWEYVTTFGEWEVDYDRELREGLTFAQVMRQEMVRLAAFSVIYQAEAARLGITIADDDLQMINEYIDMLLVEHGQEQFDEMMAVDGLRNRQHLVDIFASQFILGDLIDAIMADPAEFAAFEQFMPSEPEPLDLLGAMHILAAFDSFATPAEAEAYANEILARVQAGEDFMTLAMTYSQDPGRFTFPNGYSFAAGDMVPEFEQTTMELAMGEISGLVHTFHGIHIIKRIEPNELDFHLLHQTQPRTLEVRMEEAIFIGLEAKLESATIVFLPALDNVPVGEQE